MFQPTPKRCFTIESLVAKDNPVPASRSEEPIRPAALSYANSGQMNPFLNGFHSGGRGVYSNPDLVFAEAVSHPPNSAVPVHPVAPPHALAAHPLSSSHSPHPLFGSQQRDPSTFYPWLLHRYRYLGHRFQGKCWVFTHLYALNVSNVLNWMLLSRTYLELKTCEVVAEEVFISQKNKTNKNPKHYFSQIMKIMTLYWV